MVTFKAWLLTIKNELNAEISSSDSDFSRMRVDVRSGRLTIFKGSSSLFNKYEYFFGIDQSYELVNKLHLQR